MRRLWSPSPDMLDRRSLQVQDESVLLVGVTVVPGTKYWRWPLSLSVISGHGAGRTYPTPAGGVVRNQEISLGGQQDVAPAGSTDLMAHSPRRSVCLRLPPQSPPVHRKPLGQGKSGNPNRMMNLMRLNLLYLRGTRTVHEDSEIRQHSTLCVVTMSPREPPVTFYPEFLRHDLFQCSRIASRNGSVRGTGYPW